VSVLKTLIERLQELPGVGPKTAERLAHHVVRRPPEEVRALAEALLAAVESLRPCSSCGHVAETDPCPICGDATRDAAILCVVETSRDLEALEAAGGYRGLYHVLGGHVAPAEGIGLSDLALAPLLARVRRGGVREVVLATNPTFEGEATAAMLARELAPLSVRVTRIARGIPTGGEIVYMNAAVLLDALRGRSDVGDAS
jgi:recombination protein RecR